MEHLGTTAAANYLKAEAAAVLVTRAAVWAKPAVTNSHCSSSHTDFLLTERKSKYVPCVCRRRSNMFSAVFVNGSARVTLSVSYFKEVLVYISLAHSKNQLCF